MFTFILEIKESNTSSQTDILLSIKEKVKDEFTEASNNDLEFFTTENENKIILKSIIDIDEILEKINNDDYSLKSLKGLSKFTSLKELEKIDLKNNESLKSTFIEEENEQFSDNEIIEEKERIKTEIENSKKYKYSENINFDIIAKKYTPITKEKVYYNLTKKKRFTRPFMTKYERTKLICIRAQQLCNGAQFLVPIPLNKQDDIEYIVEKEMSEGKIPLIIRRYLYDGSYEDWKSEELQYLH